MWSVKQALTSQALVNCVQLNTPMWHRKNSEKGVLNLSYIGLDTHIHSLSLSIYIYTYTSPISQANKTPSVDHKKVRCHRLFQTMSSHHETNFKFGLPTDPNSLLNSVYQLAALVSNWTSYVGWIKPVQQGAWCIPYRGLIAKYIYIYVCI